MSASPAGPQVAAAPIEPDWGDEPEPQLVAAARPTPPVTWGRLLEEYCVGLERAGNARLSNVLDGVGEELSEGEYEVPADAAAAWRFCLTYMRNHGQGGGCSPAGDLGAGV